MKEFYGSRIRSYCINCFVRRYITLEIFVDPNHPERVNSPEAKGLRHVAVTVDKIEDLNMEIEEIRTDWFGRRFTFVKDPDGLPIEIKECGSTLK